MQQTAAAKYGAVTVALRALHDGPSSLAQDQGLSENAEKHSIISIVTCCHAPGSPHLRAIVHPGYSP